jgi:hypothetical protein
VIIIENSPFDPPLKRVDGIYKFETVLGEVDFYAPKLIVGISLTAPSWDSDEYFTRGTPVIPAIIDTGFNRILQIDQRHLSEPVYNSSYVKAFKKANPRKRLEKTTGRKSFDMPVQIWLWKCRFEDAGKRTWEEPTPLKLTDSMQVVVPAAKQDKKWPPLPLLGLQALTLNKLKLTVDSSNKKFSIEQN